MIEKLKKYEKYDLYAYILFAYLFSVACRYIWVYQFSGYEPFYWHGQLMINTNDGYFFASGVKNLIDGSMSENMRVPGMEYGLVSLTYFLAKILPFSLDTITLYMPTFVSSLIVIPLILMMRLYNLTFVGFLAALLASVTWSYYNRMMTGYYDSDMLAFTIPVFIIYFLIKSVKRSDLNAVFIAALLTCFYFYAYDAAYSVIYAMVLGYMIYLIIFYRKAENFYQFFILFTLSSIAMAWELRVALVVIAFVVFKFNLIKEKQQLLIAAVVSAIAFFYFNHVFSAIYVKVFEYIDTGVDKVSSLKFYEVHQTIREAGKIPFETFANRISGSIFSFLIAVAGYVLLVIRKKEFLLFLPLVGIGFFAYMGGLRFTVYAIPALSLGVVYLVYFVVDKLIVKETPKYAVLFFAVVALLYPNIKHIIGYKVPTVFNQEEVKSLDRLKNISTPKDYTLTWWDYGYPIWYYSNTNTLIDGGKHRHDNFIISQILTTDSQTQAANLARLSVEKYVQMQLGFTPVADYIFENNATTPFDVNSILDEMRLSDYKLPKKTRDVYLYLPNRMLNIFPTVAVFSNLDLNSGEKLPNNFFYVSRNFRQVGNKLMLGKGVNFLNTTGEIELGRRKVPVKHFSVVAYDKQGRLHKQDQVLDYNSRLNVVYMKNYNTILVLDDKMYNSVFIQLFVFENYDSELFEPVILDPLVKIYRLKR